MSTDTHHQIALTLVPGVGSILIRQLISYCGSAPDVFRSPLARLMKVPGIGEVTARAILKPGVLIQAEQVMSRVEKMGAQALFYTDKAYPARLKALYDAPALLYYQGSGELNALRTIGIVGTRQATDYGRRITAEIIEAIAPYGVSVISGLAYGIDIAAHRSSLTAGLPTIGVMASGLDVIYPHVHQKTAQDMRVTGGLLTESQPGTKPDAHLFPARNRIIAGLSDVVVVVEAAMKGGALITAEYANNYHREVFAVPGQLNTDFLGGVQQTDPGKQSADLYQPERHHRNPQLGPGGAGTQRTDVTAALPAAPAGGYNGRRKSGDGAAAPVCRRAH